MNKSCWMNFIKKGIIITIMYIIISFKSILLLKYIISSFIARNISIFEFRFNLF